MCLAVPGLILSTSGEAPLERVARVSFGGVVKEVNLAFTPDASVGDYVLVHVGFALDTIHEEEARRTFELLEELGEIEELRTSPGASPSTHGGAG
jgi:hydrogenase expression/formation protein HypC